MPRRVYDYDRSRTTLRERLKRFVRALFSSGPRLERWDDNFEGGLGVREPRVPREPLLSGAVALEPPPPELRDVRAVGDEI